MKRNNRKRRTKRKFRGGKRPRATRVLKSARKHRRVRRKKIIRASRRSAITDPRVARALGLMRRDGVSASQAARQEKMKLKSFRKRAGRFLYRSSPGKPWKARTEDDLRFLMTVLTSRGPLEVIVSKSRERKLLSHTTWPYGCFGLAKMEPKPRSKRSRVRRWWPYAHRGYQAAYRTRRGWAA